MPLADEIPDTLRPVFFKHVIGPIAHHLVNVSLDQYAVEAVRAISKTEHRNRVASFSTGQASVYELPAFVDQLRLEVGNISECLLRVPFPLTAAQEAAAKKFLIKGKADRLGQKDEHGNTQIFDGLLFTVENTSILGSIAMLVGRIEGLEIHTFEDFLKLLERPELPSVIRSLMSGAKFFESEIKKDIRPTSLKMSFFVSKNRPLAFFKDGVLKVSDEVLALAREHREQRALLGNTDPLERFHGIVVPEDIREEIRKTRESDAYSAGCPVRGLAFQQHVSELDALGLSLTDEQIEIMCAGTEPTAVPARKPNGHDAKPNVFTIQRDAVKLFLELDIELLTLGIDRAALSAEPIALAR